MSLKNRNTAYPQKILLAWAESIKGNKKITEWLMKNGYPELGIFSHALRNQDAARKWLTDHKYLHLMALINGAEGSEEAIEWLNKYNFPLLAKVAAAGDNDIEAFQWLRARDVLFAKIALEIKKVKNEIEDQNVDPHKLNL